MPTDVTQSAVEAVTEVTPVVAQVTTDITSQVVVPDQVGSVLDSMVTFGNSLGAVEGTTLAIVVALAVVARLVWKRYKVGKATK